MLVLHWSCSSRSTLFLSLQLVQTDQVERNYIKEKKAAVKEFDDKKVELKENLIAELEEKKKMIENEKLTMELTGGKSCAQQSRQSIWVRGKFHSQQTLIWRLFWLKTQSFQVSTLAPDFLCGAGKVPLEYYFRSFCEIMTVRYN